MALWLTREEDVSEYLCSFSLECSDELSVKGYYCCEVIGSSPEEKRIDATEYFLIKGDSREFYLVKIDEAKEGTHIGDIKVLVFKLFSVLDRQFHEVRLSNLSAKDLYKRLKEFVGRAKLLTIDAHSLQVIPVNF